MCRPEGFNFCCFISSLLNFMVYLPIITATDCNSETTKPQTTQIMKQSIKENMKVPHVCNQRVQWVSRSAWNRCCCSGLSFEEFPKVHSHWLPFRRYSPTYKLWRSVFSSFCPQEVQKVHIKASKTTQHEKIQSRCFFSYLPL